MALHLIGCAIFLYRDPPIYALIGRWGLVPSACIWDHLMKLARAPAVSLLRFFTGRGFLSRWPVDPEGIANPLVAEFAKDQRGPSHLDP